MGGVAGIGLMPLNFGCTEPGATIGSPYVPTPEAPLTPTGQFYVNYNYGIPKVPKRWRLYVDGLVDRQHSLDLTDLAEFDSVTREITLECIGNSPGGNLISAGAFTGVRLRDVMDAVGLSRRARGLRFLGLDGYPAYLPVSVAESDDAMLVHTLNGDPIPAVNGAPLRALIPGRFGMFNIKWLDSITATRDYATYGSLSELANFIDGETRTRSRIDTVSAGQTVVKGVPIDVTGIAATPGLGVTRVQVDSGAGWRDAEITFNRVGDGRNRYLWTLWRATWTPDQVGDAEIRVRAFDGTGQTQQTNAGFPYDGSAIHRVRVRVVS